jgi:UDP-glucose 4-epimerase
MTEGEAGGIVQTPSTRRATRVVALTGAATFLGKGLLNILAEDARIARLVVLEDEATSTSNKVSGDKVRSYAVDRTQPHAAARISEILEAEAVNVLVHLGAFDSPSRNVTQAHELESVGTLHLLNACRERPVDKLVVGSMTALYGAHHDNPNFLAEGHPLRGLRSTPFLSDKIDVERQVEAYVRDVRRARVTILRFAPLLGPTVDNYMTRWLSRSFVPTLLGFDPLMQFVHEVDALAALKLAIDRDAPGTFNIAADGVLPVSTIIKLAGRSNLPLPHFLLRRLTAMLWLAGMAEVPAPMLRFLKHLCVADGARAQRTSLGFAPSYTTRETVLEFGAALRLREARLLTESYA